MLVNVVEKNPSDFNKQTVMFMIAVALLMVDTSLLTAL